jgi:TatD DNase family protein
VAGWFDSHCHVPAAEAEALVAAAAEADVTDLVTIGCDRATSLEALEVARRFPGVRATVGLHPHEARHGVDTITDLFDPRSSVHPRASGPSGAPEPLGSAGPAAVGECGLDYHYDHSPRADQRAAFAAQIAMAHERELPLVVHTREAWTDTFELLDAGGVPARIIFHCFTGGPDEARACLDRGAYVSFSGIVTFKGAADVQAAASATPLDRLLVETDSPYLAPVPHRGERNQPAWVPFVGARLAELHDLPLETIRDTTHANARAAFALG